MKEFVEKLPFYNSAVLPVHLAQAVVAGAKYGWPGRGLRVIGVTGTNGKTTTCFMIWKMLNEAGHRTGLMTTVAWGGVPGMRKVRVDAKVSGGGRPDADGLYKQIEHMTTVDSFTLNGRVRAIAEAGAEFLVMEVTSHAMAQFRTLGVPVEIAVMTNVTHEHLDYHRTFERYRAAKCRLFEKARYGVVNADDKSAAFFKAAVGKGNYVTYGVKGGKKRATEIRMSAQGVGYKVGELTVRTQIPGMFNVYNSLAAVCVGEKLGLSADEITRGVAALAEVEGRMNRVDAGQDFEVIVDYAHTPDALLKVFASVAGHKGRIISVHGGAGRRDESTREPRGEILGKYSDVVIITEDDSRDEEPRKIAEQFVKGCVKAGKVAGKDLLVELDREKAIGMAVMAAKKGDLVLVLGKGHEKTILRKDGAHRFEDLKIVRKILRTRNKIRET